MWNQADPIQQQLLTSLAPNPDGLSKLALAQQHTDLNITDLETALTTLERHDVIKPITEDHYQIRVELFRSWVIRSHTSMES